MKKRTVTLAACGFVLTVLGLLCLVGGPDTRPAWGFTVNLPASESPEAAPSSEPTATETAAAPTGETATTAQPGATGGNPTDPTGQSSTPGVAPPPSTRPSAVASPAAEAPPAGRPWLKYIGIGVLALVVFVVGCRWYNRDNLDDD